MPPAASPSPQPSLQATALLSHLCCDGRSYTRLATPTNLLTTLSFHLYPIFPSTRTTNQHNTVLIAATASASLPPSTAFTLALRSYDRRLVLTVEDDDFCGTFNVTASQQPIREYCWSTVQLDCSMAAGYRLTVVDEFAERVDVSDADPHILSAPTTSLHAQLSSPFLYVAGSPVHKPAEYFTGHIASISLSPLAQLPPRPMQPQNTRLPPLPTRSLPLHSFDALRFHQPFSPLTITPYAFPSRTPSTHPPVMVCHDMRGGYTDDFHCQSIAHTAQTTAYAFQHWAHIDTLIYFSHTRVTIPPSALITAAHKEGVRVLGTVITEWDEGRREMTALVTRDGGEEYARSLVRLCEYHGFDGWLINMESPLQPMLIPVLIHFLATLRRLLHASPRIRSPQLVWYDSLSAESGQIAYQSHLSPTHTLPFFHAVDALFTDYHWQPPLPAVSARVAGERKRDVFTGVDIWGRGTYKGGGWATRAAMDEVDVSGTGVALFGCGWTLERLGLMGDRRRWEWMDRRFWLGDDFIEIDVHGSGEWNTIQDAMVGWQRVKADADDGKEEKKEEMEEKQEVQAEKAADKDWDSDEDWLKSWAVVDDDQRGRVIATSHRWSRRWREIDLYAHGATPAILAASPVVMTHSYRGAPPNTADHFWLRLTFLSTSRVELATTIVKQEVCGDEWRNVRVEGGCRLFRYVRWEEGGRDAEGWAGHYGSRLGRGKIEVRVGGAKNDEAVGRQSRRRKLPLQLPLRCSFNVGSGSARWRAGKRLRHESQPLLPAEEKQADVGQYGVMDDEKTKVRVGGEWSNLHEQDVQTYVRDALRAGETKQFITAEVSEEVAFEGGRSLCFTVRPGMIGDGDTRDFDVLEFDTTSTAFTTPPSLLGLQMYLKESDGVDLRPYLRLRSGELLDLDPISQKTWGNVPGGTGWSLKMWVFTLSPSDIAAFVIRARTWWPRVEPMGVKSYLGLVALGSMYSDHPMCAHLEETGFSLFSLVAWYLPSPSLDSGLYTVYLAWLPPLIERSRSTADGPLMHFGRSVTYEVEVDGMYVGATNRCLYAMEGVSERRLREGKWGVRCVLVSGGRQEGAVDTVSALMLDTEAEAAREGTLNGPDTDESKLQLDDGSGQKVRRQPLPPLVQQLVEDHCTTAGLVGEHGESIKRQLIAHIRLSATLHWDHHECML